MSKSGQALRFTHVHLENWRNFTRVDLDLGRRVLVVGPNASGKSNLFDAFRFLSDLVSAGGGLQHAVRRRGGVSRLRCLAARQHSDVAIAVRIGADENAPDWEYELEFAQEAARQPMIRRERITRQAIDLVNRPGEQDREDPERLTETCLEQVNVNREFREIAEFFASIRYVNVLPQLIREPERSAGRRDDPFGGGLLEQIAATPENIRRARLRRILEALRPAVPHLKELELWRDLRGMPHLRARYEHWRPPGAWQAEDQFSDGTLRLMCLLWTALDGAGPLLIEEPELSLDAAMVRRIVPMLAGSRQRPGRQVFLSTHSKDLLSGDAIELEEVLLLVPGEEGTSVRPAGAPQDIDRLLDGELTAAEVPAPAPAGELDQLELFEER